MPTLIQHRLDYPVRPLQTYPRDRVHKVGYLLEASCKSVVKWSYVNCVTPSVNNLVGGTFQNLLKAHYHSTIPNGKVHELKREKFTGNCNYFSFLPHLRVSKRCSFHVKEITLLFISNYEK